jgi:hypothetical protein
VGNDGTITGGAGGGGTDSGSGGAGVAVSAGTVSNDGTIIGGAGGSGFYAGSSGAGVSVSGGTVSNDGTIVGGIGGNGFFGGGSGGAGVSISGGTVSNDGTITGGAGAVYKFQSGSGGAGVSVSGGMVSNDGTITGGAGGESRFFGGNGGAGVSVSGGTVSNDGTIIGGADGYGAYGSGHGGVGVYLNGGTLFNAGTIAGAAGADAVQFGSAATTLVIEQGAVFDGAIGGVRAGDVLVEDGFVATSATYVAGTGLELIGAGSTVTLDVTGIAGDLFGVTNDGTNSTIQIGTLISTISTAVTNGVTLGSGFYATNLTVTDTGSVYPSAYGATGVQLTQPGDYLLNQGVIEGAPGGGNGYGGTGVSLQAGTLVNQGTISGGLTGFGYSGTGVAMTGGVLINQGVITSAAGGGGGPDQNDGLVLSGGSVSNTGTITGGQGPHGGVGVSMTGGAFTNSGMVTGGNANQGPGGAGLYLSGATFTNAGTISGGSNSYGGMNDAVQFGSLAATLAIDPGAVFDGNVAGNSAVHDVLELSGTAAGTLSGLGTQFTGFTTIKEDLGANWSLSGANTLGAGTEIKMYGRLGVPGQLTDAGTILVGHGGLLRAGGYGAVLAGGISLYSGSLAEGATGTLVVGNTLAGASAGALTVEAGFAVSGHGAIGGVTGDLIVDDGTITASGGGTLNLSLAATGTGTLALDSGTELAAHGTVSVKNIVFNTGSNETLAFLAPHSVTGTISGFGAGDTIDIETQKVKSVNFINGVLFLLGAHNTVLETLDVSGSYVTGNFMLGSDHHGGTDIGFAANADTVPQTTLPPDHAWQANPMDLLATAHHFGMWGG